MVSMVEQGVEGGYYIYILECSDGTLYTGWTVDPSARLKRHNRGKGARYTRCRLPVRMVWLRACADKKDAMRRELQIKKLTRPEKLAMVGSFAEDSQQLIQDVCYGKDTIDDDAAGK